MARFSRVVIWRLIALALLLAGAAMTRAQSEHTLRPATGDAKRGVIPENAEAAEELEAMRRGPRVWGRAEFLLWWIKPANFPPLVTTGPYTDSRPGALDSLDTKVLYGQNGMDYQHRTGGRFTLGGWLDDEELWSIEAGYFFLGGRSLGQSFSSPGAPVLATPFFNALANAADSSLVTFPGILNGTIAVNAPTFLEGAEANLTAVLYREEHVRFDLALGFRWMHLREGLHVASTSLVELAPQFQGFGIPFEGNTIAVSDRFDASNHFYGGQIGTRLELNHKRWTIELLGKVALGVTHEIVTIRGTTAIDTQPTTAVNGGLFAVSSNSGRFTQNQFAVVPEVGLTLKFRLTERIQFFGGYSFLYWSRVARPADQIDVTVNPNFVPTSTTFGAADGPNRPAFAFRPTDFFAHGANFGVEIRY